MCEKLRSQFNIDNIHMEIIIAKIGKKRKMRTNLTHLPIDDEIGTAWRHHDIVEQPWHDRKPGYGENKER